MNLLRLITIPPARVAHPSTGALLVLAALLSAGCDAGAGRRGPPGRGREPGSFRIVSFRQAGRRDVLRDEVLELRFSATVDPASATTPGAVRLLSRRGGRELPVSLEVHGDRILLRPPAPFGFSESTRYRLVVEGFPSLRALRSREGRPLERPFAGSFATSRGYRPEPEPPLVDSVDLDERPDGTWGVRIRFSKPVAPRSVELGATLLVRAEDDGRAIPGRLLQDREARSFRFVPSGGARPPALRVTLTTGILDLAANPLRPEDWAETILHLSAAGTGAAVGEIAEDFSTDRMLDPGGTTALWNDPGAPGTLCGGPVTTTLPIQGDPAAPESWVPLGAGEVTCRVLLTREELGPPRELTGILLALAADRVAPSVYRKVEVRITPTLGTVLGRRDRETGPPVPVLSQVAYRVHAEPGGYLYLPFDERYAYDGETSLELEVLIGPGDHTNLLKVRAAERGRASIRTEEGERPLRVEVGLRGFAVSPVATSRFYDTGLEAPVFLRPVLRPAAPPPGARMEVYFQGAREIGPSGRPPGDPAKLSPWTRDVTGISGYRYLRYRVEFGAERFRGVSLAGPEPWLDDIRIPFTGGR